MGELANYSIETDQVVLLAFRDGRRIRVHVSRLSRYLGPRDLEKVRAALKLRRDFIRKHMPKLVLVLAAGGALALIAVTGKVVATIMEQPKAVPPAPGHSAIVRSEPLPEPTMSPAVNPSPNVTGGPAAATVVTSKHVRRYTRHHHATVVAAKVPLPHSPAPAPDQAPADSPAPSPTEPPIVDKNPPADNPAPTSPPNPNQGEVLGDSTGPGQ